MAMTINTPGFSSKNYECYKLELRAWSEETEVSRTKQAIVIALSIPEDAISEKVFNQLSLDYLKQEDGLDILIQFLDSLLGKDELTDSLEKFEDFENFQRADRQSISEFIASFDLKYKKLEKLKMKLPPEILAFKLLRKANISKEMRILVLTGINYSNKEKLYEQTKASLRKFLGNLMVDSARTGSDFKLEPGYLAAHKKDLLATEFVKENGGYEQRKSSRDGYRKGD